MKIAARFIAFISVALLYACATGGQEFQRPSPDIVQLGTTTKTQVVTALGEPEDEPVTSERNGLNVECLNCFYAMTSAYISKTKSQHARFCFVDGTLVSHIYFNDATDFDTTKIGSIVKSESRREDVETILGKPHGESIYPMIDSRDGRSLIHISFSTAKK